MRELYDPRLVEEESEAGASRLRAGRGQRGGRDPPARSAAAFPDPDWHLMLTATWTPAERSEGAAPRLAPHPPRLRALLCAGPHAKGRFFVNGFLYL